jgi:chemotaxis protein methyltransferase CheR
MLPESLLERYSEFLATRIGLHYPEGRWRDLERATRHAAKDLGFDDARSCVEQLLSRPVSRAQVEILASHLTVGETYFFRDRAVFDALERRVLPELIRSRQAGARRLRVWSAGCCTGEEAYSIAILLARLIPDPQAWNILILATDINPHFLRKASRGLYTDWSFRDAPAGVKESFFKRTKEGIAIAARVKAMVTFEYHNLAEDACPSLQTNTNAMDIIFCRNVLMYFKPDRGGQLVGRLASSLLEGGWLFVSAVDMPRVLLPHLAEVKFPGAIAYRKETMVPVAERRPPMVASLSANSEQPAREGHQRASGVAVAAAAQFRAAPEHQAQPTPYQEASELYRQGRYVEAAERLQGTLDLSPGDSSVMGLLARIYANQGRFAEAEQWCGKAVAADKLNPQWCYLLATILQEQGRLEAAVAALKRALYLEPAHAMAHFALASVTRKQGKLEDSERHLRNAQSILTRFAPEEVLPESEGITVGRLAEIIASTTKVWR